jgi:hypothetical protein
VAKVWLAGTAEMARDSAKPLPPAATGCGLDRMVNRASAVGYHLLREVPSPRGRGSTSLLRKNAKSCEPEGPQDLTRRL